MAKEWGHTLVFSNSNAVFLYLLNFFTGAFGIIMKWYMIIVVQKEDQLLMP